MGTAFQIVGTNWLVENLNDGNADVLLAGPSCVSPIDGEITELTLFVANAAGNVRVGVYDALGSGSGPLNLLGESASTPAVAGWMTIPLVTPAPITKGAAFWLAYVPDDNGFGTRTAAPDTATNLFVSHTYGPLPDPWPPGSSLFTRLQPFLCRIDPT